MGAGSIEPAVTADAFIVCGTRFAICLFGCWRRFIDAFAVIASLIIVDTWFCHPTLWFGNAKAILTNIASVAISMIRARFGVVGSRTTRRQTCANGECDKGQTFHDNPLFKVYE